VNKKRKKKKIK